MINLVKRGKSQKDQEGLVNPLFTLERTLEGKVWPKGLCSNEGNTSLFWVCSIVKAKLDRYCRGVHSSMVELTSLAILPFHFLSSLINPTVDWFG